MGRLASASVASMWRMAQMKTTREKAAAQTKMQLHGAHGGKLLPWRAWREKHKRRAKISQAYREMNRRQTSNGEMAMAASENEKGMA
jgi:hypothetical protein